MTLSKRELMIALAGGVTLADILTSAAHAAEGDAASAASHDMAMPASWYGNEQIALVAYPGFTSLDLIGPHYMLASLMGATVHIVAKTLDPVSSDQGLMLVPTKTFADCPKALDIICVPGGTTGTLAAMEDEATIAFLKKVGAQAKHITSVCTGALLLGAAGLLKGYNATTHWRARELLVEFGATPVDARVVFDRNRITGAGVTAGLDFGLSLVGKLRDQAYAEGVQLLAEYAPEPPYNAGTPQTASVANREMMSAMFDDWIDKTRQAARRAMAKNG